MIGFYVGFICTWVKQMYNDLAVPIKTKAVPIKQNTIKYKSWNFYIIYAILIILHWVLALNVIFPLFATFDIVKYIVLLVELK